MHSPNADLAQYFTPAPIVEMAYRAMRHFGAPLDRLRIADPACGAGAWLTAGLRHAPTARAFGCDRDAQLQGVWADSGLAQDERVELEVGDGLLTEALPDETFDLVVGNPPFGITLADAPEATLQAVAQAYHLHRSPRAARRKALDRLRRFPLELLFLERFVTLCRPGGWVAIILPEGVAANARWRRVRQWLLERMTMRLVVGLPRETFASHKTTARTCLMVMSEGPPPTDHHVLLATLDECSDAACEDLLDSLSDEPTAGALPDGLLPPPLMRG